MHHKSSALPGRAVCSSWTWRQCPPQTLPAESGSTSTRTHTINAVKMKVGVNRLDSSTEPWQVMAPNDPTCIRVTATNQTHVCLRLYANSQLLPVPTMQSVIKVSLNRYFCQYAASKGLCVISLSLWEIKKKMNKVLCKSQH